MVNIYNIDECDTALINIIKFNFALYFCYSRFVYLVGQKRTIVDKFIHN